MATKPKGPYLVGKLCPAGDLNAQIEAFVEHYSDQRNRESINNGTSADVYFGREKAILKKRDGIKRKKLDARRIIKPNR